MLAKHRKPIIATCVVVFFLALFIAAIFAFARRYNKESIARRAREAERDAAQAVSRAARHRSHRGLALPEAEAAPPNPKFKEPALGNVVIKDADVFQQLKGELVAVNVTKMCTSAETPSPSAASTEGMNSHIIQAADVSDGHNEALEELAETFVDGIHEPLSTSRHTLRPSHYLNDEPIHTNSSNSGGNAFQETMEEEGCDTDVPFSTSLDDGGFVIVMCSSRVGGDRPTDGHSASVRMGGANGVTSSEGSGRPQAGSVPMIQLFRHQPSRSIYGESRYVSESEAAVQIP